VIKPLLADMIDFLNWLRAAGHILVNPQRLSRPSRRLSALLPACRPLYPPARLSPWTCQWSGDL